MLQNTSKPFDGRYFTAYLAAGIMLSLPTAILAVLSVFIFAIIFWHT